MVHFLVELYQCCSFYLSHYFIASYCIDLCSVSGSLACRCCAIMCNICPNRITGELNPSDDEIWSESTTDASHKCGTDMWLDALELGEFDPCWHLRSNHGAEHLESVCLFHEAALSIFKCKDFRSMKFLHFFANASTLSCAQQI